MPNHDVKFGIAIPQAFGKAPVDVDLIRDFLKKADSSIWHSVWVQDVQDANILEPASLVTYAAALTQNLFLGTAALLTGLRSPLQVAKALATLDQLSRGRLLFGVALGVSDRIYPAHGISPERRLRRFLEGVALIKRLWTEEKVTHESEFWRLQDECVEPKPFQKPHPPIWFGGSHPNALNRAVKLGDGWLGGRTSTEQFRSHVRILKQRMSETNRDPATFMIGKRVYIAVDDRRARAEQRLNQWFSELYGVQGIASSVAVYGDEQECLEQLGELVAIGAKLLILNPICDHMEHLDALAGHILPRL